MVVAILDTMVFIHFPHLKDIDWKKIVGDDDVELVVASTVMYELDRHKDSHQQKTIRQRAGKVLAWIEDNTGADGTGTLSDTVRIRVILKEPSGDYEAHGLSRDVPDDRLIMSVMDELKVASNGSVKVVSNDTTLRMKLRQRGIDFVGMPPELRHEDPLDEYQRIIAEKDKELATLKRQRPELDLTFSDGKRVCKYSAEAPSISLDEFLNQNMREVRGKHSKLPIPIAGGAFGESIFPSAGIVGGFMSQYGINIDDARVYNQLLDCYYEEMDEYYRSTYLIKIMRERAIELNIWLNNTGGAIATKSHVTLVAPTGVKLYTESTFPDLPKMPKPPTRPRHPLGGLDASQFDVYGALGLVPPFPSVPHALERVQVAPDHSSALLQVGEVVQHLSRQCPEILVCITDPNDRPNFSLSIEIVAAELPQKVSGNLSFLAS